MPKHHVTLLLLHRRYVVHLTFVVILMVAVDTLAAQVVRPRGDVLLLRGVGPNIQASLSESRNSDGVTITGIARGGAADKAALRVGDVITEFDSLTVTTVADFRRIVADTPLNRTVLVVYLRNGAKRQTTIIPVLPSTR